VPVCRTGRALAEPAVDRVVGLTLAELGLGGRVDVTRLAVGWLRTPSTGVVAALLLLSSPSVASLRLAGSVRAGCCGKPRLLDVVVRRVTGLGEDVLRVTGLALRRVAVLTVRLVGLTRRVVAAVGLTRLVAAVAPRLVGVTLPVRRRAPLLVGLAA